jgi:uncharacterized protein with NRDE domain
MCLIYVAWRVDPFYRLVVAANRDEYHARPSAAAHWWDEAGGILAGRDLEAGGTWMGMSRGGRLAAITNYRDPARRRSDARSRGALVSTFLRGATPALEYLAQVAKEGGRYNGFTLLVGEEGKLELLSLMAARPPTPADLMGLLERREVHPDHTLPDTGVGLERERALSPRFILGPEYGTRCSTVLLVSADGEAVFRERSFDVAGEARGDVVHTFRIETGA